jgi:hypothetical protein
MAAAKRLAGSPKASMIQIMLQKRIDDQPSI